MVNIIRRRGKPVVRISTTVTPELHELAYQHHLKWSECMRVGISLLLAEKNVRPYDNKLNIMRKMNNLREQLEETLQKYQEKEALVD